MDCQKCQLTELPATVSLSTDDLTTLVRLVGLTKHISYPTQFVEKRVKLVTEIPSKFLYQNRGRVTSDQLSPLEE